MDTIKHLPSVLSAARGLIGLFLISGSVPRAWLPVLAVCAMATDYLDGFLARRFRWTSAFGAALDITADGLYFLGAYVALWSAGLLPGIWLLLFLLFAIPELVCQGILWRRGSGMGSLGLAADKALGAYCYVFVLAVATGWNVVPWAVLHLGLQAVANGLDVYTVLRRHERKL